MPDERAQEYPILIRTNSDPALVIRRIDPLLSSIDGDLLAAASSVQDTLRQSSAFIISSLSAAVSSIVGLIGFLLAVMGIYGTVSYMVARRTREVGIRMALGAQRRDVVGLILRDSTRPVVTGLLAGIALAIGAAYLVRSVLYGISTVDAVSLVGVSVLFLAVALVAAFTPARRVANVEPTVALRYE